MQTVKIHTTSTSKRSFDESTVALTMLSVTNNQKQLKNDMFTPKRSQHNCPCSFGNCKRLST